MSETVFVSINGDTVPVIIEGGNISAGASVLLADLNAAVNSAENAATAAEAAAAAAAASVAGKADTNLANVLTSALSNEWKAALPGTPDSLLINPVGGPAQRSAAELFGNGYDKTPIVNWRGLRILWPGTSIPAQGQGVDSYPELTGKRLKAAVPVVNVAWAGSHASFDGVAAYADIVGSDPADLYAKRLSFISALSMLQSDVSAGLAQYGPSSAFSDTFNNITLASQMTADYRLKPAFDTGEVDVVVFDHNHNEPTNLGNLNPAPRTVTAVTIGASTQVTLSNVSGLVVGGGLTFRIAGIPKLAHAAGRIQSIAGNVVTTSVNSTGYAGALTSGVAFSADRSTLYGGFDFCLHYIYWAAANANRKRPVVILSSAPSEFTGGSYEPRIYTIARGIQAFADKWGLSMFDVATAMKITDATNEVFLPDTVHPTTRATREVFTNFWAEWLEGGSVPTVTDADYVARGIGDYRNQREIAYSVWYGGATTLDFIVLDGTNIVTENFNPISGSWVASGSTSVITAPWNAGLKALQAVSTANSESFIFRNALPSTSAISLKTTLYWPTLPTASGMNVQSAGLIRLESASGVWLSVNIVTTSGGSFLQIGLFALPGNAPAGYRTLDTITGLLSPGVPYDIELSAIQERPGQPGRLLFYVNGVDAFGGPIQTNDPTQVGATTLVLGIQSTTEGNMTVDYGPVTYSSLAVYDNRARYTGTLALVGGGTANVLLGNILSVT